MHKVNKVQCEHLPLMKEELYFMSTEDGIRLFHISRDMVLQSFTYFTWFTWRENIGNQIRLDYKYVWLEDIKKVRFVFTTGFLEKIRNNMRINPTCQDFVICAYREEERVNFKGSKTHNYGFDIAPIENMMDLMRFKEDPYSIIKEHTVYQRYMSRVIGEKNEAVRPE